MKQGRNEGRSRQDLQRMKMDEVVVSDKPSPENVDVSNTCFAHVQGRAGVGTVTGGTSARLGGGEWAFLGQWNPLCAFWWPLQTCEMQPCLGASEAPARQPCAQHMALARPRRWGTVF